MSGFYVLRHESGCAEVWDCPPFGPWRYVSGPFASLDAAIASREGVDPGARGAGGVELIVRP